MKVAVAKYVIGEPLDFAAFANRQRELLGSAKAQGAQLAILPEYLALELAAMFDLHVRVDLGASLAGLQPLREAWLELYADLARELDLHIHAGSFPVAAGHGGHRNRSDMFMADGGYAWQDKLRLDAHEKAGGLFEPGDALKVFELDGVRAGIAVGYDCEFPLPVHAQCVAGARMLLVPSCSGSDAQAARIRVGCMARALENRCFVAQAVMAGEAPWSPLFGVHAGEAALIAPMDVGLPHDGMLVQTRGAMPWAVAELDIDALDASRGHAQVSNDRDWPAQYFPTVQRVQRMPPERALHHAFGARVG